jgi:Arylsulfotransferase (ASST)
MSANDFALYFGSKARIAFALALSLAGAAVAWAGPSVFPTGVTRYDPSQAYNCDVLFSAPDGKTYLIDMNGRVLHKWDRLGEPAKMLDPALTGGVKGEVGVQLSLVPAGSKPGGVGLVPGERGLLRDTTFGYVDWAGKTVWEWGTQAPGGAALQHHDWNLLPNGHTLLLASRAGRLEGFGTRLMLDPVIYEVDKAGRIVWSWRASQHLGEFGFTPAQLNLMRRDAPADYLHFNDMEVLGPNHWADSGDARFAPENILISSRNANFIAILSRKTGKIVWRIGPNFASLPHPYGSAFEHKLPFKLERLSGQHDAHMIPEGLAGAGNILIFDNEGEGGYPPAATPLIAGSRVLEFDPVTREVVWQYTGTKATFFSPFISSAQRLPNGNTLIDEGIWGRFFQVTPKGKIVWEYMSLFVATGAGAGSAPDRWVYRAQAVPYDWVPEGVPHSEVPVHPPALAEFHIAPDKN